MSDNPRRRSTDLDGAPSWLRASVLLGVPAVIALFLVYVMTTVIAASISSIEKAQSLQQQAIDAMVQAQSAHQDEVDAVRKHYDESLDRILRSVLRTCLAITPPMKKAECYKD